MSEINKIGLPKLDVMQRSNRDKKEPLASGKAFENQLLETVEKLKNMGNEVDAMMQSTSPRNSVGSVNLANGKVTHTDVVAENFSAAKQTSTKSAKFVAHQYEQMQSKK